MGILDVPKYVRLLLSNQRKYANCTKKQLTALLKKKSGNKW